MNPMRSVCVFCGSSSGSKAIYRLAAETLGRELVGRGIRLVYGAGSVGLMGTLARTVHDRGGDVLGIIPEPLTGREVAGDVIGETIVVQTMHERKALMADLADGFLAMPGGFGTFDEFCEILTWAQLRIQPKPCGLLNVRGYFDHLIAQFDHSVQEGFLKAPHRALLSFEADEERLIALMREAKPPSGDKWIKNDFR